MRNAQAGPIGVKNASDPTASRRGGEWSGEAVTRDYYVALDAKGVRLWVFRDHKAPHGWFLQGVFG